MAISPDTYSVILSTLPTTGTLCDSHLFTGLPLRNMAKRVDCPSSVLLLNILHWQLDLLSQLVRNTVQIPTLTQFQRRFTGFKAHYSQTPNVPIYSHLKLWRYFATLPLIQNITHPISMTFYLDISHIIRKSRNPHLL